MYNWHAEILAGVPEQILTHHQCQPWNRIKIAFDNYLSGRLTTIVKMGIVNLKYLQHKNMYRHGYSSVEEYQSWNRIFGPKDRSGLLNLDKYRTKHVWRSTGCKLSPCDKGSRSFTSSLISNIYTLTSVDKNYSIKD